VVLGNAGSLYYTGSYGINIGQYQNPVADGFSATDYFFDMRGNNSHPFLQGVMLNSTAGWFKVYPRLRLNPQATPASGVQGDMYSDSGDTKLYYHNGTAWKEVAFV